MPMPMPGWAGCVRASAHCSTRNTSDVKNIKRGEQHYLISNYWGQPIACRWAGNVVHQWSGAGSHIVVARCSCESTIDISVGNVGVCMAGAGVCARWLVAFIELNWLGHTLWLPLLFTCPSHMDAARPNVAVGVCGSANVTTCTCMLVTFVYACVRNGRLTCLCLVWEAVWRRRRRRLFAHSCKRHPRLSLCDCGLFRTAEKFYAGRGYTAV